MFRGFLLLLTLKHVGPIYGGKISGHVLGGLSTDINNYPHAVFLDVHSKVSCICGGSILNQEIVLSAAHCFEDYLGRQKDSVIVKYGATSLGKSSQVLMKYYRVHDKYDETSMFGDIALLRCDTKIKLGNVVKRVAIMPSPPKEKTAFVAGWGAVDDEIGLPTAIRYTSQKLHKRYMCQKFLNLPAGTFCAGAVQGAHPAGVKTGIDHRTVWLKCLLSLVLVFSLSRCYARSPALAKSPNISGDSGGALVVNNFIQIGIVSYKEEQNTLVVYTNVSYYYKWIKSNSKNAYCA